MRILVIGASGTIGKAVADALATKHEVVRASRHGEVRVDIVDPKSIQHMYARVGALDAVVSCAGDAVFGRLEKLTDADFDSSLGNKLMGQVNVVRFGVGAVRDGGSFTLTAGIFAQKPWPGVPALALVNGALESFARAAALDLPRGIRINVVSPPFIKETAEKMGFQAPMTAAENAKWYVGLVEGTESGKIAYPE